MATGNIAPVPGDAGPDVPPVTTPDQKERAKLAASGWKGSGIGEYIWAALFAVIMEGFKAAATMAAEIFDEFAAILTELFTASQGQDTPGFNRLVSAVLSDTLGVEVDAADIAQAQFEGGRIAAMDKVGADLFNTLANEFLGIGATSEAGAGIGGLPGTQGVPLTPEQGVKAAQAFIGFALSFAVRQGNVAFISSALPWEWLSGIREYGEMMAKNLGLGRLTRRALQPFIQTLISTPLQQALNQQYRPHVMGEKQIAGAYIRGEIDRSDYAKRLALMGFTDSDIDLLIADTYTRMDFSDAFLLHENRIITDSDLQKRISDLGFNTSDIGLMLQARQLQSVQGAERKYADILAEQLFDGVISQSDYDAKVNELRLPKLETDALTRNAVARRNHKHKTLSLGFLKRAYLDASITLDEYLAHVTAMGYAQDDVDILEVELLFAQKAAAAHKAAKAAAAAKKAAGKGGTTPPAGGTPPVTPSIP